MKHLILILLLMVSLGSFSQTDSTTFSDEQVLNISNTIKNQRDSIDLQIDIIQELQLQNQELNKNAQRDSLLYDLSQQEMGLKQKEVDLYIRLYKETKPKWYNHKIIWFGLGAGTVLGSSWVVANTLP